MFRDPKSFFQRKPRYVILVSALPRSGSTLMAELLSSHPDSVLFFEPDHKIYLTPCGELYHCVTKYLRNVLTCRFDDEFKQWMIRKFLFRFFNEDTFACGKNYYCRRSIPLRKKCLEAPFILTKLIRTPLSYIYDILQDPELDVKVIHLIRDPRGSLLSLSRFRWNRTIPTDCHKYFRDLNAFEFITKAFPNKIIQIKYESFCINPIETTEEIFKFAYDDPTLPPSTLRYINAHTKWPEKGALNTFRISKDHPQLWRSKIKLELLTEIQTDMFCSMVIDKIQHRKFANLEDVRDSDVSLFLPKENLWMGVQDERNQVTKEIISRKLKVTES